MPIENLAFAGGGTRGVAHSGCYRALEDLGCTGTIKRVVGVSSGSLLSTLIAAKYTAAEIQDILLNIDFTKITDNFDAKIEIAAIAKGMISNYGMYDAGYIKHFFNEKLKAKTGQDETTFKQLYDYSQIELNISAFNLNTMTVIFYNATTSPNMKIADAIRTAMSIPFLFSAVKDENGHIITDCGIAASFPVDYFDTQNADEVIINKNTLGFNFAWGLSTPLKPENAKVITSIHDYSSTVLALMITKISQSIYTTYENHNVVSVDCKEISSLNFDTKLEVKQWMMTEGYNTTINYLREHPQLIANANNANTNANTSKVQLKVQKDLTAMLHEPNKIAKCVACTVCVTTCKCLPNATASCCTIM